MGSGGTDQGDQASAETRHTPPRRQISTVAPAVADEGATVLGRIAHRVRRGVAWHSRVLVASRLLSPKPALR
jgi:hypothetical protein